MGLHPGDIAIGPGFGRGRRIARLAEGVIDGLFQAGALAAFRQRQNRAYRGHQVEFAHASHRNVCAPRQPLHRLLRLAPVKIARRQEIALQPHGRHQGDIAGIAGCVLAGQRGSGGKAGGQRLRQGLLQRAAVRLAQHVAVPEIEPGRVHHADIGRGRQKNLARARDQTLKTGLVPRQILGHRADGAQDPDFALSPCQPPDGWSLGFGSDGDALDGFGRQAVGPHFNRLLRGLTLGRRGDGARHSRHQQDPKDFPACHAPCWHVRRAPTKPHDLLAHRAPDH